VVALPPEEILRRLDATARRGLLAGFIPGRPGELFGIEELGAPFDYHLAAVATPRGPLTEIAFVPRRKPRTPLITLAVIAFSIWPGVWLTDSMLRTYFHSYHAPTWMWYLPLTILPVPWMWRSLSRKSLDAAARHADEAVTAIRTALGASTLAPGSDPGPSP
jgi:hypothetical protein